MRICQISLSFVSHFFSEDQLCITNSENVMKQNFEGKSVPTISKEDRNQIGEKGNSEENSDIYIHVIK